MHMRVEEYVVDYNDAGFFGFFDSTACKWDAGLLERFDLSPDLCLIGVGVFFLFRPVAKPAA